MLDDRCWMLVNAESKWFAYSFNRVTMGSKIYRRAAEEKTQRNAETRVVFLCVPLRNLSVSAVKHFFRMTKSHLTRRFKLLKSCEAGIEGGDQFVNVIGCGDQWYAGSN